MYETQWQVSSPHGTSQSGAATSAAAKSYFPFSIHTEEGRFVSTLPNTSRLERVGKIGSAAPRVESCAQIHSACCAALQALQQGQRRATLVISESVPGRHISNSCNTV